jgi:hypothetical protein
MHVLLPDRTRVRDCRCEPRQLRAGALVIGNDTFFSSRLEQLAAVALRHADLVPGLLSDSGHFVPCTYNQDQEDEAAWLGALQLQPDDCGSLRQGTCGKLVT